MRTGAGLFHPTPLSKMTTAEATATSKATFSPPAPVPATSPWHSPVPYLFGGLAAMLGLIAFALLILACSYWKVSDAGADKGDAGSDAEAPPVFEEKFLVIMAGDVNPTFLATPRTCFFDDDDVIKAKGKVEETAPEENGDDDDDESSQSTRGQPH